MLMAEFATCVKYQLPVKVFVLRNDSLAQIKWEQLMFLGNPEYGCDLHPIDFAAFARACRGVGFRQALQAGQPDADGILANARKELARELV